MIFQTQHRRVKKGVKLPPVNSSAPNNLGERISVSGLKKVWRIGTTETCTLNIPAGYSVSWSVCDDRTYTPVANGTGTGTTVTYTPPTGSYKKVLYVAAIVSKGSRTFMFISQTIVIYPALFAEGDAGVTTWNLASGGIQYRIDNYADRTGAKFYIKGVGTTTGYLAFEKWRSPNPFLPCHFIFAPGSEIRTSNSYAIRVNRNCQNLLFDGLANDDYCITLDMVLQGGETYGTTSRAQPLYFEAADTDTTQVASDASENVVYGGFRIKGRGICSAGVTWQTNNTPNINYDTYSLDGCIMHDFYITDTNDEGIYIGRFTDDLSPTRAYAPITNARFFRIKVENTGADGMQWGSCIDCEMYDNEIINAGVRNDPSHKNGISWNSGNKRCFVFRNIIRSCKNGVAMHTGRGGGDCEFFDNIWINPTSGNINLFHRIDENAYDDVLSYKHYNNAIIVTEGNPCEVWAATLTPTINTVFNPFVMANNVIVEPDTSKHVVRFNGTPNTGWVLDDFKTSNYNAFVSSSDLNPKDINSPLFRAWNTGFTRGHAWSNYDRDGVKFFIECDGPLGGHYLFT